MQQIMFDVGDVVRYQESREGKIIHVDVDYDNNTVYVVDFLNETYGSFHAKDLTLVK